MSMPMLRDDVIRSLRSRHPYAPDTRPIIELARRRSWLEANISYLRGERRRAADAMRDLMHQVGIERVRSAAEATDLIALACRVFAPEGGFSGSLSRESDHTLRISAQPCPVYQAFERQRWCGVTACASWHRRRGWFDALGVLATDSIEAESMWGDPACVTVIDVSSVREPAGA